MAKQDASNLNIRPFPVDLKRELKAVAAHRGLYLRDLIVNVLREELYKHTLAEEKK